MQPLVGEANYSCSHKVSSLVTPAVVFLYYYYYSVQLTTPTGHGVCAVSTRSNPRCNLMTEAGTTGDDPYGQLEFDFVPTLQSYGTACF